MLLHSIRVRDLAGLGDVCIEGLEPGLTVLVGDNEAGKSTILTALRAALFHRHGSGSRFVKNLAPYGRQVRPEIDLEFELGQTRYRLEKRFLQKPEARLVWPGGELIGDAVEDRLAELFGFSPYSGRGEFDHERHQGAFGLLWVEQGRAPEGIDIGVGRDAVLSSLEAEVGQILGGERGRGLLGAAKALRDRHFTDGGQLRRNGELRAAEDELAALDADIAEQKAAKATLDSRIDRLADRRARLSALRRDHVIEAAERDLAKAESADRAREDARRDLTEVEQALALAAAAVEKAAADLKRRQELAEALAEAERAAAMARETSAEAAEAAATLEAGREALRTARETAEREMRRLEQHQRAQEGQRERARLQERLARLRATVEAAREAAGRAAEARRLLASALDEKGLRAILSAEAERREAAARRDGAAPSVIFHPEPGRTVRAGAAGMVETARPLRVARDTLFHLDGFGRVEIRPDTGSQEREAAYETAARALRDRLSAAGLDSVDAAHEARARASEWEAGLREASARVKALAPAGVEALASEISALEQALAAIPSSAEGPAAADVWAELERARAGFTAADAALQRRTSDIQLARAEASHAAERHEGAAAEAARLADLLARSEAQNASAALRERLAAAEVSRQAQAVLAETRRAAYQMLDPEVISLELRRARGALANLRRDVAQVENEVRELETELRITGAQGLGEAIERMEGERSSLAERVARLRLEADAARLLYETLGRAEARLREKWFAPIRAEVAPYLRLVHPEAEIAFDEETLRVTGVTRRGVPEEFHRLSHGAREQVAVVTRLALAQVLRKGGHPATVILDDALVNTDEARLARMHLVLQKAAEHLQIIVLTCRERDFRGLGAPLIRL
ncbi:AAA family ATPase [Aureimonas populi]|uniref:AAA family ATPase n=1 Tax=Aureimonas populi TaxID=1701758 RepID=A0ABW5CGS1_9HYPH|nr:AAA family ATPase [Aureimonas populi]